MILHVHGQHMTEGGGIQVSQRSQVKRGRGVDEDVAATETPQNLGCGRSGRLLDAEVGGNVPSTVDHNRPVPGGDEALHDRGSDRSGAPGHYRNSLR